MKKIFSLTISGIVLVVIIGLLYKNTFFIGESSSNFTGTLVGPLQEADLITEIEGIKIGDKFNNSLKEKLGTPLKVDECLDDTSHTKTYFYSQYLITVSLYAQERISIISIIGKGIKTNRGLMIGDDENKVIDKYGPCNSIEKTKDEIIYKYSFKTKSGNNTYYRGIFITLSAKTNKVIEISLIGGY